MKDFGYAPDLQKVAEAAARRMCRADEGLDPDTLVYPGTPYLTRHGFLPGLEGRPAWTFYMGLAIAGLDPDWFHKVQGEYRATLDGAA